MTCTQMTTAKEILARGYFPRELPPPFNTYAFATFAATNPAQGCFQGKHHQSTPMTHTVARPDGRRRLLTVPNPASFLRIASEVAANWAALNTHCSQSPYSSTTPAELAGIDRAIGFKFHRADHDALRAERRTTARFALIADIVSFYPSIYTHSIPWALHGKAFAKANRGELHLGNRLDKHVRNGQDGQTVGLPVGPDTSLVLGACRANRTRPTPALWLLQNQSDSIAICVHQGRWRRTGSQSGRSCPWRTVWTS